MRTTTITTLLITSAMAVGCGVSDIDGEPLGESRQELVTAATEPGCVTGSDKPAQLTELSVAGFPSADGEVLVRDGTLLLEVRTAARDAVSFQVEGTLRAGGETSAMPLATGRVTSAAPALVRVPIDAFALRGYGAASLRLEVKATGANGQSDRSYAPRVLLRRAADGALFASRTHGAGPYEFAGGAGDRVSSATVPDGLWHFCFKWEIATSDSGHGEDFHANDEPIPARGAKLKVENAGMTLFDGNADASGCVKFASQAQSGFKVTARSQAKLGGHEMVAFNPPVVEGSQVDEVAEWSFTADPLKPPTWVNFTIDSGDQQIAANLIAFTSHTVHRVVSNTTGDLFAPGTVNVHAYVLGPPLCEEGCTSGNNLHLLPAVTDEKFGISHEVGHWLHGRLTGNNNGGGTYTDNEPGATACSFSDDDGPGRHAMRSREFEAAAFTEGFGHFVAALAWNNHNTPDGWFRYYKHTSSPVYQDMANASWAVDLSPSGDIPLGGQNDWYHTMCKDPKDGKARSVELDWLRFLWNLRTDAPSQFNGNTAKPTHEAVFRLIKETRQFNPWANGTGVYAAHTARLTNSNPGIAMERWLGTATQFGVKQ